MQVAYTEAQRTADASFLQLFTEHKKQHESIVMDCKENSKIDEDLRNMYQMYKTAMSQHCCCQEQSYAKNTLHIRIRVVKQFDTTTLAKTCSAIQVLYSTHPKTANFVLFCDTTSKLYQQILLHINTNSIAYNSKYVNRLFETTDAASCVKYELLMKSYACIINMVFVTQYNDLVSALEYYTVRKDEQDDITIDAFCCITKAKYDKLQAQKKQKCCCCIETK